MSIAIIAITRNGVRTGSLLCEKLAGAGLYVLPRYMNEAASGAHPIEGELKSLVARLWPEVRGFVFIMATGIVVRLIAPLLERKDLDPAVVVLDDGARHAISLLSGHLGGGNELAERVAFVTSARAVITTATDVNGLPSFDMLARDNGWEIEELGRVKTLNSLLLDDEQIAVVDTTGLVRPYFHGRGSLLFFDSFVAGMRSGSMGVVFVSNSIVPPQLQSPSLLVLRPKNLCLGIGCNRGTSAEEIETVVLDNLNRLLLSPLSIASISTADAKRGEPGLVAVAEKFGVPLLSFESCDLNMVSVPSPPSHHAMAAIGATGVAEPAALLASRGGELLLKKIRSGNLTLAIAEKKN